eukprot:851574_1
MSTIYEGNPTAILMAKKCWRMKKKGGSLEQRGGKGLIAIKLYPFDPNRDNPQPFMLADQGCMEILRTGIACRGIKHKSDQATILISCQDWSHRESLKNPIKRHFYLQFKTSVRADFFLEIWNELFEKYETYQSAQQDKTTADSSLNLLSTISKDAVRADEGTAVVTRDTPSTSTDNDVTHLKNNMTTNLNLTEKLAEESDEDDFDEGEECGRYSDDDDLWEQTQPTTEPLRFDLKRK